MANRQPDAGPDLAQLRAHLEDRQQEIGRLLVQRYTEKIVEYRSLPEGFLAHDIEAIARQNLIELLKSVDADDPESSVHLETFRNSAIRRFRQGVPVQALLHAYRLWGQTVWDVVMDTEAVRADPRLGLRVAGRIMEYVDLVSMAVAQSYLEVATGVLQDRELVQREVLEQLIAGEPVGEHMDHLLRRLGADPHTSLAVIVLRQRRLLRDAPEELRASIRLVRETLSADATSRSLVGVRDEEVVVVCPMEGAGSPALREKADALAVAMPQFTVGLSRPHATLQDVSLGYHEAREAIQSAPHRKGTPRAYAFADILLRHVVDTSDYKSELQEETVLPLRTYDVEHGTDLLATLRAYVGARFSLSQTASTLHVQPNTVRYRLDRIRQITGRDPASPDDLLLLALAIRAGDDSSQ